MPDAKYLAWTVGWSTDKTAALFYELLWTLPNSCGLCGNGMSPDPGRNERYLAMRQFGNLAAHAFLQPFTHHAANPRPCLPFSYGSLFDRYCRFVLCDCVSLLWICLYVTLWLCIWVTMDMANGTMVFWDRAIMRTIGL